MIHLSWTHNQLRQNQYTTIETPIIIQGFVFLARRRDRIISDLTPAGSWVNKFKEDWNQLFSFKWYHSSMIIMSPQDKEPELAFITGLFVQNPVISKRLMYWKIRFSYACNRTRPNKQSYLLYINKTWGWTFRRHINLLYTHTVYTEKNYRCDLHGQRHFYLGYRSR